MDQVNRGLGDLQKPKCLDRMLSKNHLESHLKPVRSTGFLAGITEVDQELRRRSHDGDFAAERHFSWPPLGGQP